MPTDSCPRPPNVYVIRDLIVAYGQRVALRIPALDIAAGSVCCLHGPNGAGKSTLLEVLAGLRPPRQGRVDWAGCSVYADHDASARVRRTATLVLQRPLLFHTTVERNVDYGLRVRGIGRDARRQTVARCLEAVGLAGFQKRPAQGLSGGEAQRVAIARALALAPAVLLLDEFSAGIDTSTMHSIETLLAIMRRQGSATVVLATHDRDLANRLADHIVLLTQGRVENIVEKI